MKNSNKDLDIIIVDTEYTAWEGSHRRGWSEPWEHREIIQIAAAHVILNKKLSIVSIFDVWVQPTINPVLSDYITKLTGITQTQIDSKGLTFKEALRAFQEYCGFLSRVYCWGNDEMVIQENCAIHSMNFEDYFTGFFDIRHVFKQSGIDVSQYESGSVYKSVHLTLDQPAHYALNDVYSMCETLRYLLEHQQLHLEAFSTSPRSH